MRSAGTALFARCQARPPWRDPRRTECAERLPGDLGIVADPAPDVVEDLLAGEFGLPAPVGEGLIGYEMSIGQEPVNFGFGRPPGFLGELLEPWRLTDADPAPRPRDSRRTWDRSETLTKPLPQRL